MKPKIRTLDAGDTLTTQGEAATDVYVVMDGMFAVEIDGEGVAEIGPGAVVGERAALEGGVRTATLRATTRARVAPSRRTSSTPRRSTRWLQPVGRRRPPPDGALQRGRVATGARRNGPRRGDRQVVRVTLEMARGASGSRPRATVTW